MGANCCVAARHKDLPQRRDIQFSTHRNVRHSPSWNFRWSNRTHIEDIVDNLATVSHGNSRNAGFEMKSSVDMEAEGISGGESTVESFGSPNWCKSPTYVGTAENSKGSEIESNLLAATSLCISNNSLSEGKERTKFSATGSLRRSKASTLMTPPPAAIKGEPSSSRSHSLPMDPSLSRKSRWSPGYQFSKRDSDNRATTLKPLDENNSAEGRRSHVLSVGSNDLSAGESHGGSSDGWSMRLFSELVASSQRERWSFGSENVISNHGSITGSNSRPVVSPPRADSQACGVCSRLLKERSSWSSQKIVCNNELSVIAVLICGHVYHAECLENVTHETDRYDPICPVCVSGEKSPSKLLGKGKAEIRGRNKVSRNAIADIDFDGVSITEGRKSAEYEAKGSKLGSSSSFKSFGRPFLRRHFSIGSRSSRSMSENERAWKNLWGRYRRNE
uniref:E3 ubiquitin-protein ligase RMA2 n=1 Tax=Anthurium amnicola TaxID=1678845 RepID=A0A1D1XV90_9ARAE